MFGRCTTAKCILADIDFIYMVNIKHHHHFGHCVHHWCRRVIILITSDLNLDHLHILADIDFIAIWAIIIVNIMTIIIIIIGIIIFIVVNVSGSSSLPVRQCTEP